MRKVLLLCACALASCSTQSRWAQNSYRYYEQSETGFVPVDLYVGMRGADITAKLGAPVYAAQGRYQCRLYHEFSGIMPGANTTEWAFRRGGDLVVVWLDNDVAAAFGVLPER